MEHPSRLLFAGVAAVLVALGCGPSVRFLQASGPGLSAAAYLHSATPAMVIEVTPTTNHHPTQAALDLMVLRAQERCFKPAGITLQVDPEAPTTPSGSHQWTVAELLAFESAHAQIQSTPDKAVLNVFYLDGTYSANSAAIALSYTGHSIAVFSDMLGPDGPEGPALVHELDHQLGLVNGTAPELVPHQDGAHGIHDVNPQCVMFFSLNPSGTTASPDDYCENCKADLRAAGGR